MYVCMYVCVGTALFCVLYHYYGPIIVSTSTADSEYLRIDPLRLGLGLGLE